MSYETVAKIHFFIPFLWHKTTKNKRSLLKIIFQFNLTITLNPFSLQLMIVFVEGHSQLGTKQKLIKYKILMRRRRLQIIP